MKFKLYVLLISSFCLATPAWAHADDKETAKSGQTISEKAKVKMKNAKRATKKGYHRAKEAVCLESDAECAAKKAKHRFKEGAESVEDKASEIKDKLD